MQLTIRNLTVHIPGRDAPVLNIPALSLPDGTSLAVSGASGSGKTTLFNQLSGLADGERNRVFWDETDIHALSPGACDRWRGEHIGIVMQEFHLINGLDAIENIILPAAIRRFRGNRARKQRAADLLDQLGITVHHQAVEKYSRGEKQRIAIARALLNAPQILIADEPTASLDAENAENIARQLCATARENHATLICMTHDHHLRERLDYQLELAHGNILRTTLNTSTPS